MTQSKYVVYCAAPFDGPGEYSEEVDVQACTAAEATAKAQQVLDEDYMPGMRAVRAVEVPAGYWY